MNKPINLPLLLEEALHSFDLCELSDPLADYLLLLNKWNLVYNLTAICEVNAMVSKHILDSLSVLPWLKGTYIIDVGTGAGLPGIPLAMARPELNFVLLDSNGKKTRFLCEVKRQLHLKNVEIVQLRAENYTPNPCFETVLSRAFSNLMQMTQWTQHLIAPHGVWLAMKGRYPDTELNELKQPYRVHPYTVLGMEAERCCVLIENSTKE